MVKITNTVTVVDSIMGSGKTTWLIDNLRSAKTTKYAALTDTGDDRYLVLTELNDEVRRIQEACPEADIRSTSDVVGSKTEFFRRALKDGNNIATTHSLFRMMDRETYSLIKARRYHLVIDETISCFELFNELSPHDADMLFSTGKVYVEEKTGKLRWNAKDWGHYRGDHEYIRLLCDNGNLTVYKPGTADRKVLIWEFPVEFLQCFESVTVLTYLFDGSPFSCYLRAEGFTFDMKAIVDGKLVDRSQVNDAAIKAQLKPLITVYDSKKANSHGEGPTALSVGWLNKADRSTFRGLKFSTVNFFEKVTKTKSAVNAWTTFKRQRPHLAGKGYARGFIPNNCKATNAYKHKEALAYLCNRFHNPVIKGYFADKGVPANEGLFALSEMIQWIWRSRIREGKPIHVYIPSERMRGLFLDWLDGSAVTKPETPLGERLALAMSLDVAA